MELAAWDAAAVDPGFAKGPVCCFEDIKWLGPNHRGTFSYLDRPKISDSKLRRTWEWSGGVWSEIQTWSGRGGCSAAAASSVPKELELRYQCDLVANAKPSSEQMKSPDKAALRHTKSFVTSRLLLALVPSHLRGNCGQQSVVKLKCSGLNESIKSNQQYHIPTTYPHIPTHTPTYPHHRAGRGGLRALVHTHRYTHTHIYNIIFIYY